MIQCPGCSKLHLIADNIDFFGFDKKVRNVEQGGVHHVRRLRTPEALSELTPQDRELVEQSWHERDRAEEQRRQKAAATDAEASSIPDE